MTAITERLKVALADRYRIERELGAGGMATVYLAHDLRHDRQVALKLLRPELGAILGGDRFLQEIKVTANLQHPHILPLFDSGSADGLLFYVMPLMEGETLRERLDREKQLPVAEAVRIASELASALDYAHRHGVIHRDIKPENILLHDNRALVADFGIALAVRNAGGSRLTETGLSLGTPHYMSPEQATGDRELDARTDVYAVGCVLYEMLTGAPPYTGPTAQAVITKLVTEEAPPVTGQRRSVPPDVADAVHQALEKLPADRFATAAEFAAALTDSGGTGRRDGGTSQRRVAAAAPARRFITLPWMLVAAAAVVILVLSVALLRRPTGGSGDVVRAILELPRGTSIGYPSLALSRDGSRIVVSALQDGEVRLLQRPLDRLEFTAIPGSEGGNRQFLSPDGQWVAFGSGAKLRKVPLEGGPAVDVADSRWAGGDWTADGTIIYTPDYVSGLWRVPAGGGTAEQLTTPDSARGELAHWWPQVLPDGKHVLFTAFSTPIERARIEVLSLETGERTVVLEGGVSGRYVPTGYLLYARSEALFAVPFDVKRRAVTGQPVPVLEDLAVQAEDGRAAFSVSDNGTLAYISASAFATNLELVWVTRRGSAGESITAPGRFDNPSLSPDRRRVALAIARPGETRDVWILDLVRGTRTPLTSGGANDFAPVFTPDGRYVIYESEQPVFDLYTRVADASAPAVPLVVSAFDKSPGNVTRDGTTLVFGHSTVPRYQIWSVPVDGGTAAAPLLTSESGDLARPAVSPAGRWLAFTSTESGSSEVYITGYPDVTRDRRQVSADGGLEPRWTRGGRELVYRIGRRMMAVAVDPASGELGTPAQLFSGDYMDSDEWSYDVTPDGERFLMLRRPPGTEPRQVIVVTNWFRELERLVPGRGGSR
jgi:serine/threonine-protein kinase